MMQKAVWVMNNWQENVLRELNITIIFWKKSFGIPGMKKNRIKKDFKKIDILSYSLPKRL